MGPGARNQAQGTRRKDMDEAMERNHGRPRDGGRPALNPADLVTAASDTAGRSTAPTGLTRRGLLALAGGLMAVTTPFGMAVAQAPVRFPAVEGQNALGEDVRLPQQLPDNWLLVALSLNPRRQRDLDAWANRLEAVASARAGLGFYEMVVAGRRSAVERYLIERNIRDSVRTDPARQRTFVIYEDQSMFRRNLDLARTEDVFILVARPNGDVAHIVNGRANQRKVASLERVLDRVMSGNQRISGIDL